MLKNSSGFILPSFGTFRTAKTKARKALNSRTGEPVKVKARKTVRFKVSPALKKSVLRRRVPSRVGLVSLRR